jgi:hypothetical protein
VCVLVYHTVEIYNSRGVSGISNIVSMKNVWGMAKRYWQKKKTFEFYWNVAGICGICILGGSVVMDDSFKQSLFPSKKVEDK